MLWKSLALLLVAATFHAITNVLIKNAKDKLAFGWWMLAMTSVPGIPILFLIHQTDPIAWKLAIASGFLEAIYFFSLYRANTL
jgi:drug/metabolite transporter (DMT)-like permease